MSSSSPAASPIRLASEPDFQLGSLQVRPSSREVSYGTQRLILQPRVMQVLVALAGSGGRIVSRDELTDRCWGGRVVSDGALNRVISQLRKLSDLDRGESFTLETVSRVGYGLRKAGEPELSQASLQPDAAPHLRRRGLLLVGAAGGAVAIAAAAGVAIHFARPTKLRIAVLPFDTADGASQVLADGLSEDLITSLLTVKDVDVVARSSTFTLRGAKKRSAGETLGATHVLDGSVERQGDRVRVNVHLIDARKQSTIWSQQYEADAGDLFATQSRIARDATGVLELAVTHGRIDETHVDPIAYRLFTEGRDLLNRPDPRGEAIPKLLSAVDRAPGFSRGWSMLSAAYVSVQGTVDTAAYTPFARTAARDAALRALRLDPRNAQARVSLAAATDRQNAWGRVEDLYLTALREEPSNVEVLYAAGNFYADVGWNERSIRLLRRAQALDPLNPAAVFLLLRILEAAGKESEIAALLPSAQARWPGNRSLWRFSTRRAVWNRRLDEAAELVRRTPPGAEQDAAYFADLIACRADPKSPRLATFTAPARGGPIPFTWPIFIFALGMLDQPDACVALIRRVFLSEAGRQQAPAWVLYQSMVRPVWRNPNLRDVLEQLGLQRFWASRGRGPDGLPFGRG